MGGGRENNRERRVCEAWGSGGREETCSCRLKGTGQFPGWPDCTVTTQAQHKAAAYAPFKTFVLEAIYNHQKSDWGSAAERRSEITPKAEILTG